MDWVSFNGIGIGKIYLDSNFVNIFGLEIKWYAVIICFGLLISLFLGVLNSNKFNVEKNTIFDILPIALFFGVVGCRVYYVVFNLKEYRSGGLLKIFNIREGGLAIYGGIIFVFLSILIYCKVKKIEFLPIADLISAYLLLGQSIGRWGNFVNIEAYGDPTNLPWGMYSNKIFGGLVAVHPTFFYESLWCFIGFLVLFFSAKKRKFNGQFFLIYFSWYGFERFFVEGIRADSLWLVENVLKVSQLLSFVLFIVATSLHIYVLFFYLKKPNVKKWLLIKKDKGVLKDGRDY